MRASNAESVPAATGKAMPEVCALLESITRVAHGARIYGWDHPQVAEAAARATTAYKDAHRCAWPIELVVGRDAFTHDGDLVNAGSDVACLANAMYESGIAVIRLRRAPGHAELAEVAGWIGSLPQPRGGELPACARETTGVFEVVPVTAGPLRFTRTSAADGQGVPADWDALCRALAAQATEPVTLEAVENLRTELGRSPAGQQELATRVLTTALHLDPSPHPSPQPVRSPQTAAALGTLTPELRRSMLAVCAARGSDWLAANAETLPVNELVDALRSIDRPGHAPPAATVLLLRRLVGSASLSESARASVSAMERSWSADDASLAGLMRSGEVDDLCPGDYHGQLGRAAAMIAPTGEAPSEMFRFEPVALRVCELSLELLAARTPDELTADHLHLLLERIEMLAEAGRVDLMVAAAEAASRMTTSSIEAVARHAEQLASATHAPSHVGHVVRRLGTCDESIASLAQLLVIAPEPVITTLANQLTDLEIGMDHAHITSVAAAVCPQALRSVIAEAIQEPAPWLNGLIDFLSACPDEVILVAGEPLFRARNPETRARTLRVLDGRLGTWPGRLIEIALSHPDSAIAEIGRRRLEREPANCRPEILAALLTGSLTGELPSAQTALTAIDALVSQGEPGVERAAIVLRRLAHGCNRRRASICKQLAITLEPFRDRPAVAGALRAWRISACGLVFEFFTAHIHQRAA